MNGVERGRHFAIKALVDQLFIPVVLIPVLHHLKIGDDNAARVTKEVGNDVNTLFLEHSIRFWRCGAIGEFDDDAGFDVVGINGR